MDEETSSKTGGLSPEYKTYEHQKCFVAHSHGARWCDDVVNVCNQVLPEFGLEPWYAADHFDPTKPLRDKMVELIANTRYGIYDLSYWRKNDKSEWHMPRNVLIELGVAIALNRPTLLLRHAENRISGLQLPTCLESISAYILEFSGGVTLQRILREHLSRWVHTPPEHDWWNRYCMFGNRICEHREAYPRGRQWGQETIRCHISDGQDADRLDFRGVVEEVLGRFSDVTFGYLDALPMADGYNFLLCTHCQTVRSTPFAIYRITPQTPAETFLAIGMSLALEAQFTHRIPKILLTTNKHDIPSLLSGYEVVEARNDQECKTYLRKFMPDVIREVRRTTWRPRPLPFIAVVPKQVEKPVADDRLHNEAVAAARQLLQRFKAEHPEWENDKTPIDELVSWHGLEIATFHQDDRPEGTYGWLEPEEDLIWLCRGLPETLRRFTLAHELGHAVLHRYASQQAQHVPQLSRDDPCQVIDVQEAVTSLADQEQSEEILGIGQSYNLRSQRELAANIFAAELLMPLERVQSLYLRQQIPSASLAGIFGVSATAMLNRLAGPLNGSIAIERATPGADGASTEHAHPPSTPQKQYDEFQQAAIEAATPALIVAGPGKPVSDAQSEVAEESVAPEQGEDSYISKIGKYGLIREINRGSFATVYLARDMESQHVYAVKIMHPELAQDSELLSRFRREASILKSLNDPHIVRIVGDGNENNVHFIVMDYIDGQNLKYYIVTSGPMEPLRALNFARQIAEGLDAAYKQGVVHRNIRPQDILINSQDVVKITDFGMAWGRETATLTQSSVLMGTPYYISPEQVEDTHSADIRSDLYSLAVVFFEMLIGRIPFDGGSVIDIVLKHRQERVPSISSLRPDLPVDMDAFFQKAMAKSPADRYQTPREFIGALDQLQQHIQALPPGEQGTDSGIEQGYLIIIPIGEAIPLTRELMVVGRQDPRRGLHPDIDLTALDPKMTVSRRHAYLRNRQGQFTVEDLNASNKTSLNGATLAPSQEYPLNNGDILRFAIVEARFELRRVTGLIFDAAEKAEVMIRGDQLQASDEFKKETAKLHEDQ